MSKKLVGLAIVTGALVIGAATSASTAVTQVFSPAGMTQGPYLVENFEDAIFVPGATFTASSGIRRFSGDGVEHTGAWGLTTNSFPDPITISFGVTASSMGLWFGNDDTCCSSGFTANLDIFAVSGLLGTISIVANMNDRNDQFLGFISNELVTSVTHRYGTGANVSLFHAIDDVMFNTSQVPEPGTLAILGFGLVGLGYARRRKAA